MGLKTIYIHTALPESLSSALVQDCMFCPWSRLEALCISPPPPRAPKFAPHTKEIKTVPSPKSNYNACVLAERLSGWYYFIQVVKINRDATVWLVKGPKSSLDARIALDFPPTAVLDTNQASAFAGAPNMTCTFSAMTVEGNTLGLRFQYRPTQPGSNKAVAW